MSKDPVDRLIVSHTRAWIESELWLLANIDGEEVSLAEMPELMGKE